VRRVLLALAGAIGQEHRFFANLERVGGGGSDRGRLRAGRGGRRSEDKRETEELMRDARCEMRDKRCVMRDA
jgi:hypothetical protein